MIGVDAIESNLARAGAVNEVDSPHAIAAIEQGRIDRCVSGAVHVKRGSAIQHVDHHRRVNQITPQCSGASTSHFKRAAVEIEDATASSGPGCKREVGHGGKRAAAKIDHSLTTSTRVSKSYRAGSASRKCQ